MGEKKRGIKEGFFGFCSPPREMAAPASIHHPPVSQNPCLEAGSGCQESGSQQRNVVFSSSCMGKLYSISWLLITSTQSISLSDGAPMKEAGRRNASYVY